MLWSIGTCFIGIFVSARADITWGKFLHITDFHIDPFYKVGSSPESACHLGSRENGAGPYGNRKCDTPIRLARDMLGHIRDHHSDFDFIVLTGDIPRHDNDPVNIPKTRKEIITTSIMARTALAKYFPTKPVLFTIGNNDLFVHDQLEENSADLKAFFLIWRHFIPRDQWETFATSGYYTVSGYYFPLDMIVLNTMFFYKPNELVEDCDVEGSAGWKHLKWLKMQLKLTRMRGSFAYLIGHVAPSKRQYHPACLKKFVKLTRKYSDVIHTQLYGHSNYDEFFVGKSDSTLEPTNKEKRESFGLVAPSMVPILNPAYRIVSYNLHSSKFGQLLEYNQYYFDLEEANLTGFKVKLEYNSSEAYGPGPLTTKYYRKLQDRMRVEPDLRERYQLHRGVMCLDCPQDRLFSSRSSSQM